jgi:hypothetical protein
MKISVNYALATGSDISPHDKEKVLKALWHEMEDEGRVLRSKVETQMDIMEIDGLTMIEGLDYALVGIADYPHDCVIYDYVRCVEIFAVRDAMSLNDASEAVEQIISDNETEEDGPIFVYPLDYLDEEQMDDYDILNAHEVVFNRSEN